MAAAARRGGFDPPLEQIRNTLAVLQSQLEYPSELENNIIRIRRSDIPALANAVADYANTNPDPVGRAAKRKIRKIKIAIDAFYDYVKHREDHTGHEHVIGRAEVAEYLQDALDDAINHFGGL